MNDRRKRLINYQEERVGEVLSHIAKEKNAHVYPKLRIADVLNISSSGLTDDEYSYALRAHFDWIVADENYLALFAVEFDGPHHDYDQATIARDAKKNRICNKFNIPLLRVTAEFLNRKIRRFTLLSWITEIWFLEQAFYDAQEAGTIPFDEPFMHDAIISDSVDEMLNGKWSFPYDLSWPARVYLANAHKRNICLDFIPTFFLVEGLDDPKYTSGLALFRLDYKHLIIGRARCRLFSFGSVNSFELCQDLVTIDVAEKLNRYMKGEARPDTKERARKLVQNLEDIANRSGKRVWRTGAGWEP